MFINVEFKNEVIGVDPLFPKSWMFLNFKVLALSVQSPASRVQRPGSSIQGPASSVQSPASRVQRPESRSSVQSPASNSCAQSPGIPVRREKVRKTKCDNRNVTLKANHKFFKMGPYYPKTLEATFLNYMKQRQVENERYDITSQI